MIAQSLKRGDVQCTLGCLSPDNKTTKQGFKCRLFRLKVTKTKLGGEGGHIGPTLAPEAILFESPCRAHSETKIAQIKCQGRDFNQLF